MVSIYPYMYDNIYVCIYIYIYEHIYNVRFTLAAINPQKNDGEWLQSQPLK